MTAPLWLQVVTYAVAHADESGRLDLWPWELRRAVDPHLLMDPSQVSRAIRTAEHHGYLAHGSTARRLILATRTTPTRPRR